MPRPKADGKSRTGTERYQLIRDAFQHAQEAFADKRYLEVIPLLESIMLDRLGSLMGGSLGRETGLQWTIGQFKDLAKKNVVQSPGSRGRGTKKPLPDDVLVYVEKEVSAWFEERNHAVHGMAKLHHTGDDTFAERYAKLEAVALRGFRVLLHIDKLDVREKEANGAGNPATWPDALTLVPYLRDRLAKTDEPAS